MFSQRIIERIQHIPEYGIKDKYVVNVMTKLCIIALSDKLLLEKRLEHVETVMEILSLLKTLEHQESQKRLTKVYQSLFHDGQSNKISLNMAIALKTVEENLKERRENNAETKFYLAIEAAADFLAERKQKLINEISINQRHSLSECANSRGFFSNGFPENTPCKDTVCYTQNP